MRSISLFPSKSPSAFAYFCDFFLIPFSNLSFYYLHTFIFFLFFCFSLGNSSQNSYCFPFWTFFAITHSSHGLVKLDSVQRHQFSPIETFQPQTQIIFTFILSLLFFLFLFSSHQFRFFLFFFLWVNKDDSSTLISLCIKITWQ